MTVDISIFTSEPVGTHCWYYYDNEYEAAEVVKIHLEYALDYWGYSHDVTVASDYSYTVQKSTMSEELDYFEYTWLDGHSEKSSNSNLMLLDQEPDGYAGIAHLGGAGSLKKFATDLADHHDGVDRYGDPSFNSEKRIRGSIHESGHNLGMEHADGLRYDSDGTTYSTPHGCETGGTLQSKNNCEMTCSQSSIDMFDHYFADCAENEI